MSGGAGSNTPKPSPREEEAQEAQERAETRKVIADLQRRGWCQESRKEGKK
jgi:hypothetical protein